MRIADICTTHVISISPDASVREAAETMRKRHAGSLVVIAPGDGQRVPTGIVTDRDIVVGIVAAGVDASAVTVADVMTRKLVTCKDEHDLFDAIGIMRLHGVRRLPVLDATGGLAGMVTADDIYGALGTHLRELGHALSRGQLREMEVRT